MARTVTCDLCGKPATPNEEVQHPVAELRFQTTIASRVDQRGLDLCTTCTKRLDVHWPALVSFLRDRLVGP